MSNIKLNKKYRIFWMADKTLPENYRTPYPLTTTTSINTNYWSYYQCDTVKELDAKIKSEGLKITEHYEIEDNNN